jgi:hypothetical protein
MGLGCMGFDTSWAVKGSVGNNIRNTHVVLPRLGNASIVSRNLVFIAIVLVILAISYCQKYFQAYIASIVTHTGQGASEIENAMGNYTSVNAQTYKLSRL